LKVDETIYRPGILERWGKSVLFSISKKRKQNLTLHTGDTFQSLSNEIIFRGTALSFLVGFIPSFLFVWIASISPQISFQFSAESILILSFHLLLIGFFTVIEFYLLFRIGLYETYLMAEYANLELIEEPELITPIPGMLTRIALEIPDPAIRLFGIDPYKTLNKRTVLLKTLLYKIKVMISNIGAKVLLKAILGRTGLRMYIEYISAPITGFWDAYVTYKILLELRKRIISRKIAEKILIHLKENHSQISNFGKQALLRAIANSIVFTKTFHPNFEYLLLKLVKEYSLEFDMDEMDDQQKFEICVSQLPNKEAKLTFQIFLIASCFDGKLTKEELELLPKLVSNFSEIELNLSIQLSRLIQTGNLKESIAVVDKMLT